VSRGGDRLREELPRLLTVDQVAGILGVRRRTAYSLIDRGAIACYRFGRLLRIAESDLAEFIAACRLEIT